MTRPHVLLSVAVSLDGYIDDRGAQRFPLSNAEDFDHVDQARAESDAILVGAATIRRDNPRLLVRHADRRAARVAAARRSARVAAGMPISWARAATSRRVALRMVGSGGASRSSSSCRPPSTWPMPSSCGSSSIASNAVV